MDSYPFVLGIIFLMCCGKSESHPYFSQSLSLNALPVRIGASAQKSFSRENDKNTCILWFRRVCHSAKTQGKTLKNPVYRVLNPCFDTEV